MPAVEFVGGWERADNRTKREAEARARNRRGVEAIELGGVDRDGTSSVASIATVEFGIETLDGPTPYRAGSGYQP